MANSNGKGQGVKILLCLPCYTGSVRFEVMASVCNALRYAESANPYLKIDMNFMTRGFIDRLRQESHEKALKDGYDFILWWDDDMVVKQSVIIDLLLHDKDVVGAMCFTRKEPYTMFAIRAGEYGVFETYKPLKLSEITGGIVEVDAVGTGLTMMKPHIVDGMKKPWWQWPEKGSEDLELCMKLRKKGIKIYVDTGIEVGHLTESVQIVTKETHKSWIDMVKKQIKANPEIKKSNMYPAIKELVSG